MKWTKTKTSIAVGALLFLAVVTAVIILHFRARDLVFSSRKEVTDTGNVAYVQLTGTTPADAAKTFLDACSRNDWTVASKYFPPGWVEKNPAFIGAFTNQYSDMVLVSLGKPFKGKVIMFGGREYPGVYVPYEIRLRNGTVKKWQLAIRCDNGDKHWYWDGGM